MPIAEDITITLGFDQHFRSGARDIRVDLSSRVNFSSFQLQPYFNFNTEVFSSVEVDKADPAGIIISVMRDVQLSYLDDAFDIDYTAQDSTGEVVTGKVVFTNDDYRVSVNDITYELEDCCCLPDSIIINIRNFNSGQPFIPEEVGGNNTDAGTVSLHTADIGDFNNDYNTDFDLLTDGTVIIYTFNKDSGFWKNTPMQDSFTYVASLNGKQASGKITIVGKSCFTTSSSPQPYTPSEFLAQENTYLINQENESNIFL